MAFAAGLSEHPVPAEAAGEAIGQLLDRIGPEPDLAWVFATAPVAGALEDIAATVRSTLSPGLLVGASAVSVLGGAQEVEERAAVAVWAGDVGPAQGVRLSAEPRDGGMAVTGMPAEVDGKALVVVADPFSFPTEGLLDHVRSAGLDLPVVGGLASAGRGPGGNRLILDDAIHDDGAVGVLVDADRLTAPVVSQGCRPIGQPMTVTEADGRLLLGLAGRSALEALADTARECSEEDRLLLETGLHLGLVVNESRSTFERGDFLIRPVVGVDRERNAVAVGEAVPVGATVQFQVRDAVTADEDLRALLTTAPESQGALVFTCNGRGSHLFGTPHHDAELIAGVTGGACAGMFCAGEIGPVGTRAFLHGFTASVALFR